MFGSIRAGELRRYGDAAITLDVRSPAEAAALADAVRAAGIDGVTDVVGAFQSVLVIFDPELGDYPALVERVRSIRARRSARRRNVLEMPVDFDGPDLDEVGRLSGLGADGVRRALVGARLRVAVVGFAPGFAYLSGLPRALRSVPRRPPRASVPGGSFAIAAGHAAVYPQASPGGWNLLGRTDLVLFDPAAPPYTALRPGDEIRVREAELPASPPGRESDPRPARRVREPAFIVETPGFFTTVQDRGRVGVAHLGVPRAGAADPDAFELANALLGNPPGAAALEITLAGPTLVCHQPVHVAVVGPGADVFVDGAAVGPGRVLPLAPGHRLTVRSSGDGARSYLAARGGFLADAVLGSASSDRLAGLGPGPLRPGDQLALGPPVGPMGDHLRAGAPATEAANGERRLRVLVVKGRPPGGWQFGLFGRPFEVQVDSDRVGVRLRALGAATLHLPAAPRESAGVTTGTVQVPPDGNPVVLMADHATLGGYPVAACVISADLGQLARCKPGETVVLEPVTLEEAATARRALRRGLDDAVVGRYPTAAA